MKSALNFSPSGIDKPITWSYLIHVETSLVPVSDLEPDDTCPADPAEEWLAAVEALCEVCDFE